MDDKLNIDKPIFENFEEATTEATQAAEKTIDSAGAAPSKSGILKNLNVMAEITQEHDFDFYKNHIFNIDKSEALAHIIRGISSIVGELNLAIFDIVVGLFKMKYNKGPKLFGEQ